MKMKRLALLVTLNILSLPVLATEFSAGFLKNSDHSSVDLSAFNRDGYVAPGDYLLDIYLNDRLIRSQYTVTAVDAGDGRSLFCITPALTDMLGLKEESRRQLAPVEGTDGRCLNLTTADSRVQYSPDNQSLTVTLPQAWMEYQDPDWVPPARWDDGVSAALLDYNLMANRYMPHQGDASTSYSLYGTAGFNLGAWRLRSDYQYNRYDSGNGNVQSDFWLPQTYLFRPLPSLRSKLTLGQTYLSSAIFDSFRFAGITLASDE
ncbi:fimbrial biogenesis outer membrane usher protein, partial [Salmonella enterica]|nr:fimbrial biogenesis outer membrane usher protein [Salmonella enterica]EGN3448767.1 fimbria/pilus outer membrane usher protein [Salmonella enterica subsp. enterica serovar Muenchen]EAS3397484.1 fimbrial biogenesis outer membrane usher protein [Salmonella enterica]EBI6610416.1 fimbrial biogenesis outer membrane usher protein [Salmonella enterica]EBJ8113896.1 fimbrial biogenesis outer membrane usher protein [Salmonella enterica]